MNSLHQKVLVLHSDKGLVRDGQPNLTLFNQVNNYHCTWIKKEHSFEKLFCTWELFWIPSAVLGCYLIFCGHGFGHLPSSPDHQVYICLFSHLLINLHLFPHHQYHNWTMYNLMYFIYFMSTGEPFPLEARRADFVFFLILQTTI